MNKPAILFIGHDASRTGAPMALLHFMRWFKEEAGWPFSCLLKGGGELEREFAALCPTTVLEEGPWRAANRRRRILGRMGLGNLGAAVQERLVMSRQVSSPGLIYCNTIAALPALELAVRRGGRVLCHVHELEFAFRTVIGPVASRRVLDLSDRFIACSQVVADNLVERHQVAPGRIDVVHEFIPTANAETGGGPENRRWLRKKLGVGPNAFVIGGSGALGWRKGTDLFVQLGAIMRRMNPRLDVHFLWLGGDPESWLSGEFRLDLERAGLADRMTLIPTQPDPLRYFGGLDLFVLPSREDPFPLVCLEAAACGCPILCFDGAGGMPEFVEDDCGAVAPYLDIHTMASDAFRFLTDPELRDRHGRAAYQKVRARHDVSIAAPKIMEAIRRTLKGATPPVREAAIAGA